MWGPRDYVVNLRFSQHKRCKPGFGHPGTCPSHRHGLHRGCSAHHDEDGQLLHSFHGVHVWIVISLEEPRLMQEERPWLTVDPWWQRRRWYPGIGGWVTGSWVGGERRLGGVASASSSYHDLFWITKRKLSNKKLKYN